MDALARSRTILQNALEQPGPLVFLTGAGISAESGIPTFRGNEGYWTVGSRNYQPEDMATWRSFSRMPEEVWSWYLYRWSVCRAAQPNSAHAALVELERRLSDRFLLITQNVDGLHLRSGNTQARTYQIHGNLDLMRCSNERCGHRKRMPDELLSWERGRKLASETRLLHCTDCGNWMRPNVLWFDECYDEERYRFESSLEAAQTCCGLIVIGTSGATNLPMQVAALASARDAAVVAIDPEPSTFTAMAVSNANGTYLQGTACDLVPKLQDWIP